MNSILTVTTERTDEGRLVTLDELKTELSITTSSTDDYYNALLLRASQAVEQYCSRVFAVLGVTELLRPTNCAWPDGLILTQRPIISIGSIDVDGAAADAEEFENDDDAVYWLASDVRAAWSGSKIEVAYIGGYATTPGPVQQAVFELVKLNQAARTRDPALRSENILEGLYSYTLFNGENLKSVLDGVTGLSDFMVRRMVW